MEDQHAEEYWFCSLKRPIFTSGSCVVCVRTTKQWSRWSFKEGVPQWDMFPGPTEFRLIGCSIELIWIPKSKSSTSTPKANLPTCEPKEISRVMSGIISCACSILGHFSSTVCSDTMAKRSKQDSGWERVTAKSRPMMNLVAKTSSLVSSSTSVSPVKR